MSGPDAVHRRPAGVDDATVEALGKLSEALEVVEQARGFLYGFHRLTGKADLALGEAVELLRTAGRADADETSAGAAAATATNSPAAADAAALADEIESTLIGRNVIEGRWTFQLVEEYDDGYYAEFKAAERKAREQLAEGRRHLFEAEMKEDRRTHGRRHHEARPAPGE